MHLRTLLLAFLLLFTTLSAARAELNITVVRHDTDVQSTYEELKVCSCGSTVDVIRIKNVGQLEATYVYELQADQPWFTIERNGDTLRPGQTKEVRVYTHAPCGTAETGGYRVFVTSEYGRYRAIDKTVQAGVCENIHTFVTPRQSVVQPCRQQVIEIHITNVGTFQDTYHVQGLSDDFVQLRSGESTVVIQTFVASCNEWGERDLAFRISSERNNLAVDQIASVTIPRAYDFTFEAEQPAAPVCTDVTSILPVTITNLEDRDNTFVIEAEPWSNSTTVYVEGKDSVEISLPFTPARDGERTVTITARGQNGSIEKQTSIPVSAEVCYGISVSAPATTEVCAGDLYLPFAIKSAGTRPQTIMYDVLSNATTRIDRSSDTLYPTQTLAPQIYMRVPDADRSYYVTLEARSAFTSGSATTTVQGYSTESCYAVAPAQHEFRVWTDQTVLPVVIRHTGIQPTTYEISYNSTFIQPDEKQLTLLPGGEAVLHLTVKASGHETGRYVDRLTLSSHGVDYTTDFEIQLREKGPWQHFVDAWRWSGDFWLCSIASIIALLLLVAAVIYLLGVVLGFWRYYAPSKLSKQTIGIVGAALLIVLLLLMITSAPTITRTYERPIAPANESELFFEIGATEELRLDLTQYFIDPDNDALRFYTPNQPEGLLVRIEGNEALVKARGDWSGQDTLVFTADDGREGTSDSDLITISVVPFKPVTFIGYWTQTCWFVTWLLLFLLVLTLLALALTAKPAPRRREHISGDAQALIELGERRMSGVEPIPPGVAPQTLIGTQVQANNIVVQQKNVEEIWVGSEDGTKFHRMSCPIVKNMPTEKRKTFATREEAIKAGYTPCKTCRSHD